MYPHPSPAAFGGTPSPLLTGGQERGQGGVRPAAFGGTPSPSTLAFCPQPLRMGPPAASAVLKRRLFFIAAASPPQ